MKRRLCTPGPTPVPHAVRAAMALPMVHHREEVFLQTLARVRARLKKVFGTTSEVMMLAGTGTLAMDAAVANFLSPGDTALYVDGGKFGERWGEMLAAYGVVGIPIKAPWGRAVTCEAVQQAMQAFPHAKACYVQACETSTGVTHPTTEIAALTRTMADCLCVVDGITAVGISDLGMDAAGIDVLLGASQKSLMMAPGLAFVGVSAKAWARAEQARLPRFYHDLRKERAAAQIGHTAWTSVVSLVMGLDVALDQMTTEGLANVYARHALAAQLCRQGAQALGCTLYADPPCVGLTAVVPPAGIAAQDIIVRLDCEHGMRIGGGQGEAAGKILRLAHMGEVDRYDVQVMIAGLAQVLADLQPSV